MKIAVLLGGTSAEREVSIASGIKIAEALSNRGHDTIAIDTAGYLPQIDIKAGYDVGRLPPDDTSLDNLNECDLASRLKTDDLSGIEVVFVGLHGGSGEDGTIQALLNLCGITYTGSDVLASAAAMDKAFSKMIFKSQGIPTPQWLLYPSANIPPLAKIAEDARSSIGYPLVVKPNAQGSTVGLTVVSGETGLEKALQLAAKYGDKIMVERYISGRELTVAVVGDYDLPVVEIIPEGGLYNYECKYTSGKSQYVCPAELPDKVSVKCKNYAKSAFEILGCRDYGRVDFRMDEQNNLYCLEVNTLPGMTPTSLVPKAMKAVGIQFDELIEIIAKSALARKNG
ncbi:MAG: D-alanine--D-alanine ligase [candidate division Zixibacteria bacterium]|nr:D-alanine--D-alanine ligase [candidate division Zixibacteria bacterium]